MGRTCQAPQKNYLWLWWNREGQSYTGENCPDWQITKFETRRWDDIGSGQCWRGWRRNDCFWDRRLGENKGQDTRSSPNNRRKVERKPPITQPASQAMPVASPSPKNEKAKAWLPKLEVKKFSGRIHEWQEFWDSHQSAIHSNPSLSDIDKFSYLPGLIEGPAKASIAGFALTKANYNAAIELLQRRFGKKIAIERAILANRWKYSPCTVIETPKIASVIRHGRIALQRPRCYWSWKTNVFWHCCTVHPGKASRHPKADHHQRRRVPWMEPGWLVACAA